MAGLGNVVPALRYMWLTLKHKAFVFRAGLWTGAPLWLLIIHDWTKFTPARQFFGAKDDPQGFARAWRHHWMSNPHHWEHWADPGIASPMPERYVREMVAGWLGAARAYNGAWPSSLEGWDWLTKNWGKIHLHPESRQLARRVLAEIFDDDGGEIWQAQSAGSCSRSTG
jgi:hypothetical protein